MRDKVLAFYIRLSVEDGDLKSTCKKESNSIANQRELLAQYYREHPDLQSYTVREFCDDGYSGTSFNRPQFQKMMGLIREGKVQCVLVKDLSRFGREYLEISGYLELILPLFGTRFISVNDGFDSDDYQGTTGGLGLALHNLINGMYSRDISQKVRSALRAKGRRGLYWGGSAFYGYLPDPRDKRKLVVNEETRDVIEKIFSLCIDGKSTRQIALLLNQKGIPCPAAYKKQKGIFYHGVTLEENPLWLGSTVRSILRDQRYTGKMVSGTRESVGIRSGKIRSLPQEEWTIVDCSHEAIITEETFQKAALSLSSRLRSKNGSTAGYRDNNLFVCGYCGRRLQKSAASHPTLFCPKTKVKTGIPCENLREDWQALQKALWHTLKMLFATVMEKSTSVKLQNQSKENTLKKEISLLKTRLQKNQSGKRKRYEEYRSGQISREHFILLQEKSGKEDMDCRQKIARLEKDLSQTQKQNKTLDKAIEEIQTLKSPDDLPDDLLTRLVKNVRVFPEGRMEILLKSRELSDLLETGKISVLAS